MHIILCNPRGFCAGVNMAIQALNEALKRFEPPIYVYHEIVHNTWVVDEYRVRGVRFVNTIDEVPVGGRLLFSAHGVSPEVRKIAAARNIRTIDATCPLVNKVHREVLRYAGEGATILLIGHRGHDEVIGVMGEAPEAIQLIEKESDIEALDIPPDTNLAYLTQTTLAVNETRQLIEKLHRCFPNIVGPMKANICYATQNRQEAIRQLGREADVVLVVGSRSSSNSRRLAERAESLGVCSYLVDGPDDIATGWFRGDEAVLVTAGASAPEYVVQKCVDVLRDRFHATVEEKTVFIENVVFPLPKEMSD